MKKKIIAIVFFLFCTIPALAEDDYPENPDSHGDPPAPVDQWMVLLLFLGVAIGFYFLKRKYKTA